MKTNYEILNFQILNRSELEKINGGQWVYDQNGLPIWIGD